MATIRCHSNQRDKKQYFLFPLPINAICEIWRESASEEMSFENVDDDGRTDDDDDGRTTDACLYYKLTYAPSAQVS